MDAPTKKLFAEHERAFDKLEIEKQVGMFADTSISAGPKGTIAQNRDAFMKMSRKTAEFYRSVGQTGAKIVSMKETPISDGYSMVTVHWAATFEKTGDTPIEFDVSYFIQKTDPQKPLIIMFIAHQDEDAAMRALGLAQDAAQLRIAEARLLREQMRPPAGRIPIVRCSIACDRPPQDP